MDKKKQKITRNNLAGPVISKKIFFYKKKVNGLRICDFFFIVNLFLLQFVIKVRWAQ